jgi:4-aminobutyrate aminotransferase-like enzyme/Ser/Thr protein kinase RdoA (MazF antagonist)
MDPRTGSDDVMLARPPALSPAEAARVAAELFAFEAEASPLASERDQNFRLRAADGRERVLKLANPAEDPATFDFQIRALLHLERTAPELPVPRVVAARSGSYCAELRAPDGRRHGVRLVSFLDGDPLEAAPRSTGIGTELGAFLARLGQGLRGFFHPAARGGLLWDLSQAGRLRERLCHVEDEGARARATRWLEHFELQVAPRLPGLRAQVIHNDASGSNVLVDARGERVVGLIDFGDLVHAPLLQEVAVAMSELMLVATDPLEASAALVAGYDAVERLREEERGILVDLVAARLSIGIAIASWRGARFPENRVYIAGDAQALDAALARIDANEATLRAQLRGATRSAGAARTTASADAALAGPAAGLELDRLLARRTRLLGPTVSHFYEKPLHLVRGRGSWLHGADGRAYLDAYNNVPHVGHCHPLVVEAISRQASLLDTNTRYLTEAILDYAERLTATLPAGLEVCLFACSGSEANDLAWRMASAHTGNSGALVVTGAYHGSTAAANELSPAEPGDGVGSPRVRTLRAPDDYRGPWRRGAPDLDRRAAADAEEALASLARSGLAPAAFFVDPLLTSSGILVPPTGWLAEIFRVVRSAGGLCVVDEVQTGFGRTGAHFWGFEAHGVVPDLVTLGKPIANGYPMAAVVTRPEIARSFARKEDYFSTFGGSPVACAAALAVLDVIEGEGLRENARRVGARLRAGCEELAARHPLVGDVRGAGLFLGIELVRDRATREPAPAETRAVVERLRDAGILVGVEGPLRNVVKIRPPLVFSAADADLLLTALDAALHPGTLLV